MDKKLLAGLIGFSIVFGIWFVDTNNKWLAEKEADEQAAQKASEERAAQRELAQKEAQEESKPAPVETTTEPTSIETETSKDSDPSAMSTVECMQIASEKAGGDFAEYQKALEECG